MADPSLCCHVSTAQVIKFDHWKGNSYMVTAEERRVHGVDVVGELVAFVECDDGDDALS